MKIKEDRGSHKDGIGWDQSRSHEIVARAISSQLVRYPMRFDEISMRFDGIE